MTAVSVQTKPATVAATVVSLGSTESTNGDDQYQHAETVAALAFGLALAQLEGTTALDELLASADRRLFALARARVRELARHDRIAGDQALRLLDAAMESGLASSSVESCA